MHLNLRIKSNRLPSLFFFCFCIRERVFVVCKQPSSLAQTPSSSRTRNSSHSCLPRALPLICPEARASPPSIAAPPRATASSPIAPAWTSKRPATICTTVRSVGRPAHAVPAAHERCVSGGAGPGLGLSLNLGHLRTFFQTLWLTRSRPRRLSVVIPRGHIALQGAVQVHAGALLVRRQGHERQDPDFQGEGPCAPARRRELHARAVLAEQVGSQRQAQGARCSAVRIPPSISRLIGMSAGNALHPSGSREDPRRA